MMVHDCEISSPGSLTDVHCCSDTDHRHSSVDATCLLVLSSALPGGNSCNNVVSDRDESSKKRESK